MPSMTRALVELRRLDIALPAMLLLQLGAGCSGSDADGTGGAGASPAGAGGEGASTSSQGSVVSVASSTIAVGPGPGAGGSGGGAFVCDPPAAPGSIYEKTADQFDVVDPVPMCKYRGDVMLIFNGAAL